MKLRGSAAPAPSVVDMASPLFEARRRRFGRAVTPAVLVALAVGGSGQLRHLVGEGAPTGVHPLGTQAVAILLALEEPVLDEPLEERRERGLGDGEETRELRRRR